MKRAERSEEAFPGRRKNPKARAVGMQGGPAESEEGADGGDPGSRLSRDSPSSSSSQPDGLAARCSL